MMARGGELPNAKYHRAQKMLSKAEQTVDENKLKRTHQGYNSTKAPK